MTQENRSQTQSTQEAPLPRLFVAAEGAPLHANPPRWRGTFVHYYQDLRTLVPFSRKLGPSCLQVSRIRPGLRWMPLHDGSLVRRPQLATNGFYALQLLLPNEQLEGDLVDLFSFVVAPGLVAIDADFARGVARNTARKYAAWHAKSARWVLHSHLENAALFRLCSNFAPTLPCTKCGCRRILLACSTESAQQWAACPTANCQARGEPVTQWNGGAVDLSLRAIESWNEGVTS